MSLRLVSGTHQSEPEASGFISQAIAEVQTILNRISSAKESILELPAASGVPSDASVDTFVMGAVTPMKPLPTISEGARPPGGKFSTSYGAKTYVFPTNYIGGYGCETDTAVADLLERLEAIDKKLAQKPSPEVARKLKDQRAETKGLLDHLRPGIYKDYQKDQRRAPAATKPAPKKAASKYTSTPNLWPLLIPIFGYAAWVYPPARVAGLALGIFFGTDEEGKSAESKDEYSLQSM